HPDFIVFDPFLLAYYPFFWCSGIRAVALSTKPLAIRDPYVPPYTSGLVPSYTVLNMSLIRFSWFRVGCVDTARRLIRIATRLLDAYTHDDLVAAVAKHCKFDLKS